LANQFAAFYPNSINIHNIMFQCVPQTSQWKGGSHRS